VGFTKRPALLDPIDWVRGWPTVNGGSGPSDDRQPAPAGQPGQESRHSTELAKAQLPKKPLREYSDEFRGSALSDDWAWEWPGDPTTAPPAPTATVVNGVLTVPIQAGDLYVDSDNASVLLRDAPRTDYVVETRVRVSVPDEGCCYNYAQAGIVVYGDEDNYLKLTNSSIWNTRQTEFAKELNPVPEGWARYGNTVVGPPSEEWTYLRIVAERLTGRERTSAGGDTEAYTAYTSQDGVAWVRGGTWTHSLGRDARIALVAYAAPADTTFTAEFDYVRTYTMQERSVR
jgi:arabinan endo-1,5-alpha-L-arabinosidase